MPFKRKQKKKKTKPATALSEDEVSDVAGDIGMPLRPLSPASGDDDDAFDATNDDAPLDDAEEEEDDEEDEDGDSELLATPICSIRGAPKLTRGKIRR